ncbi:hypothetical protein KP509_22G055400 [Ceratopteris richardii]|uniref:Uncharacterized protein n=1 Tax=Ceratopteris richardii TaxID=49495 RepID=A0A8T2S5D0_CERRI|nr:hypothetical protein KP509_22G055400 [Ceratopteris richardii]KAH7307355.1 hypothetical protein KP509_22G055400 [Ceratopteris richardii]
MPSWWRFHARRDFAPWQLPATHSGVLLTPRYVIGLLAFLICVDMTQVLGVLCYQLFLGSYFPWHLYPLLLNRAVELLALLCSDGYVPSVYSMAQIFLTVLSMVICIQKQPCGRFNCVAALVLYGVLLTYQIFLTAMVVKIASIPLVGDGERHGHANRLQQFERQNMDLGPPLDATLEDQDIVKEYNDIVIAVEQPDGEKYAIARLLKDIIFPHSSEPDEGLPGSQSKILSPLESTNCRSTSENSKSTKDTDWLEQCDVYIPHVKESHAEKAVSVVACNSIMMTEVVQSRENIERREQSGELGLEQHHQHAWREEVDVADEEEHASNVFLTSLTNEIIALCKESISRDQIQF